MVIQVKAIKQYASVVLCILLYKVVLIFQVSESYVLSTVVLLILSTVCKVVGGPYLLLLLSLWIIILMYKPYFYSTKPVRTSRLTLLSRR